MVALLVQKDSGEQSVRIRVQQTVCTVINLTVALYVLLDSGD